MNKLHRDSYTEEEREFVDSMFCKPVDAWTMAEKLRLLGIASRATQDLPPATGGQS